MEVGGEGAGMAFGLKVITYEEDRLDYFKQQLAHQERRLDFAIKHNRSCWDCAEIGREVGFYQDIVEMLEQQMKEG